MVRSRICAILTSPPQNHHSSCFKQRFLLRALLEPLEGLQVAKRTANRKKEEEPGLSPRYGRVDLMSLKGCSKQVAQCWGTCQNTTICCRTLSKPFLRTLGFVLQMFRSKNRRRYNQLPAHFLNSQPDLKRLRTLMQDLFIKRGRNPQSKALEACCLSKSVAVRRANAEPQLHAMRCRNLGTWIA